MGMIVLNRRIGAYTVSGKDVAHGLLCLAIKAYADILRGSLASWCQMTGA